MAVLLFTGDSITDAGRRSQPSGHLGFGYVRLIADELAARGDTRDIVSTGISGNRMRDLRARWTEDVLAHEPSALSVYIGINDTWRRYDSGLVTSAEEFERDYRAVLAATSVDHLVLVEPFVLPVTKRQNDWAEDLDPKRAVVAALADEFGAHFVALHGTLSTAAEEYGAAMIAADGVHPTELGARLIADAWLAAVG